tara:strand:+ start:1080 stop:2054 length:975 start_codon:yes stop_codon:yes gene_type:complete
MNILITGVAGFIGFHLAKKLLKTTANVIGIDNLNNYYDVRLKKSRLNQLKKIDNKKNFKFIKIDISDKKQINKLNKLKFDYIVHLAAQAGVRHSLKKPEDYVKNNLIGFFNILELSKIKKIKHLLFASTSSVYGDENRKCLENFECNTPLQFYAATKKSNEVMAHSYSSIYKIPTTGLRFFTVYGPWGRPDMALFIFVKNILNRKKINVFNYGNHKRDFTYVDDIAESIKKLIKKKSNKKTPFEIFNIGNSQPIKLRSFIKEIEINLKTKSKIKYLPLQKGDIPNTNSNSKKLFKKINFKPKTNYKRGIKNFISWYLNYYEKKF